MTPKEETVELLKTIGMSDVDIDILDEGIKIIAKTLAEQEMQKSINDQDHKNKHFVFKAIFKTDESGPDIKVDIEGLRTNEILSSIAIMLYELMDKDVIAPKDVSILAEVVTRQKNCDDNG